MMRDLFSCFPAKSIVIVIPFYIFRLPQDIQCSLVRTSLAFFTFVSWSAWELVELSAKSFPLAPVLTPSTPVMRLAKC